MTGPPTTHKSSTESAAAVALGANLGDRASNIRRALDALADRNHITLIAASSIIETPPLTLPGSPPQSPYLNAAALLRTSLPPRDLLRALLDIEQSLGRTRDRAARWAPRTIDLDLLLYADRVIEEPGLTIPHPRLHERRFVLEPLAEIAPHLVHPILKRTVAALLADLQAAPSP
ncbi:MAG: 2-amino-4-hydroxy-6-hydroxymethyldihydropteridine diphosphokinase [Planctomycetota bacterium]|nr:2-amino-4-hydroxy-6-hydroxymethyldihydropteridine diphosphokinase [Planctomycetota bacterium]